MNRIFVALSTFAEHNNAPLRLLEKSRIPFTVNPAKRRLRANEIPALARNCTGIIAGVEPYDKDVLQNLPELECISRCGVGIDNIDIEFARQKGIAILNTPDVVIQPVAELTVAMIFDLLRHLTRHTLLLKSQRWEKHTGYLIAGRKIGILGLGRIGKRVAEILRKLDADVLAYDIQPDSTWMDLMGVRYQSEKEILESCDVITVHVSVNQKDPFFLGARELQAMKPGSFLVNVARGGLVEEDALYAVLHTKHLAGAALDVFGEEPYRGRLCELENIILTPHIATLTKESRLAMECQAVENIVQYLSGRIDICDT